MIEFHGNAVAPNDVAGSRPAAPKRAKFEKHIPLDVTAAAARSLRHTAAIDRINHLVVHGDDVPLIVAAIDAEVNDVARPKSASTKDLLSYFFGPFVFRGFGFGVCWRVAGAWCAFCFFLLISFLGPVPYSCMIGIFTSNTRAAWIPIYQLIVFMQNKRVIAHEELFVPMSCLENLASNFS